MAAHLRLMLPIVAFARAPQDVVPAAPDRLEIHVDARRGDDRGDGSSDQPFATIRKALALHAKTPERGAVLHLGLGHYGADTNEALPVRLPANVRLVGYGSRICEIVGVAGQPVIEAPASGAIAVESVALRDGSVGVAAAAGDARSTADVTLVDVAIEDCERGVDLSPARGAVALRADGLRVRKAKEGLLAGGAAALTLALTRSSFVACREGVVLSTEGAPDEGPSQSLTLRSCRFDGNDEAGLVRRGKDGRSRATTPWLVESSSFRGSRIGLSLEIPGADVPFVIRDCLFAENENFGLALVGSGDALQGSSTIVGCRFRWNGVGAQLLTLGRELDLVDCRFEDSIGVGLSFGNWVGDRSILRATRCLFARNGGAGIFGLCEREDGIDVALDGCTIADNRGSGIERKNRKRGSGPWLLTNCVVAGNAPDLVKIEPAELRDCFVGGDPRFVDRAGRDYRLADDSPARAGGAVPGAFDAPREPPEPR